MGLLPLVIPGLLRWVISLLRAVAWDLSLWVMAARPLVPPRWLWVLIQKPQEATLLLQVIPVSPPVMNRLHSEILAMRADIQQSPWDILPTQNLLQGW